MWKAQVSIDFYLKNSQACVFLGHYACTYFESDTECVVLISLCLRLNLRSELSLPGGPQIWRIQSTVFATIMPVTLSTEHGLDDRAKLGQTVLERRKHANLTRGNSRLARFTYSGLKTNTNKRKLFENARACVCLWWGEWSFRPALCLTTP